MYTHFASSFFKDGQLDTRFKFLMERLGKKNGWFVPVTTMLDYLLEQNGHHDITTGERSSLERRWLLHHLRMRMLSTRLRSIGYRNPTVY